MNKENFELLVENTTNNLEGALLDLEDNPDNIAVVDIYIPDRRGTYINQDILTIFGDYTIRDYPFEIGSSEERYEADELMEDISLLLNSRLIREDILHPQYEVEFGWYDSEICVIVWDTE